MMGPTEPLASGVISYNGDSERGWNDPPTLSFSAVAASRKGPKLDLRKRVSHQEALTGRRVTSPFNQSPLGKKDQDSTSCPSNSRAACQQLPASNVSPCHSRHSSGTLTPPLLPDAKSYGIVPPNNSSQSIPLSVDPTPPSNLGQPLFSFPNSFKLAPVSNALDASHVRSNPCILPDASQGTLDGVAGAPVYSSLNKTQGPLIFTLSATYGNNTSSNSEEKNSPILNRLVESDCGPRICTPPPLISGNGRNSPLVPSTPPLTKNQSPVLTPTSAHSPSNSPRSSSPCQFTKDSSRHNSDKFNSEDALKMSVDAIEKTIMKCNQILQTREVEDVRKKIGIMKQLWTDGKLSLPVQISMNLLTKALMEGDTVVAHKLHLKLMVENVGEVKQWMVAIKRLISAVMNLNASVS